MSDITNNQLRLTVPSPTTMDQQINAMLDLIEDAIDGGHPLDDAALVKMRDWMLFTAVSIAQVDHVIRVARKSGVDCSRFVLHDQDTFKTAEDSPHKDFAKIVRASDGRQVLFYVEPDGGDYELHTISLHDGYQADLGIGFQSDNADLNERNAYKALNAADQVSADKAIQAVIEMMGEAA